MICWPIFLPDLRQVNHTSLLQWVRGIKLVEEMGTENRKHNGHIGDTVGVGQSWKNPSGMLILLCHYCIVMAE
jgi:hypothetical protein